MAIIDAKARCADRLRHGGASMRMAILALRAVTLDKQPGGPDRGPLRAAVISRPSLGTR